MPSLYLIRHAEPLSHHHWDGPDDTRPLSERGRRQAEQCAHGLKDSGATELRSAPHRRCVETAEIIGKALGLTPVIDDALHIRHSFTAHAPAGTAIWVAHSNNIPGAVFKAGARCTGCGMASVWRLDFDETGSLTSAEYFEPDEQP